MALLSIDSSSILPQPPPECDIQLCIGYQYYHYCCDGKDDQGWGCGYRTLQTVSSWIAHRLQCHSRVPSLLDIQRCLVQMGDKEVGFVSSREWIGSVEVALVVDKLYQVDCKIVHVNKGSELPEHQSVLLEHFLKHQSPIMMGGEMDTSSKGLVGIAVSSSSDDTYLLVLDPHYCNPTGAPGQRVQIAELVENEYLKWRSLESFHQDGFYNLCLPQTESLIRQSSNTQPSTTITAM